MAKTKGNVCEFDFYVVNFDGGHAKLPTDAPNKFNLTLSEAIEEFKRQCSINPSHYITAIGVDYHTSRRDLEPHGVGACDLVHFKDGKIKILEDHKRDKVIEQESLIRVNALNIIKRDTADLEKRINPNEIKVIVGSVGGGLNDRDKEKAAELGFKLDGEYTLTEFNKALKIANEKYADEKQKYGELAADRLEHIGITVKAEELTVSHDLTLNEQYGSLENFLEAVRERFPDMPEIEKEIAVCRAVLEQEKQNSVIPLYKNTLPQAREAGEADIWRESLKENIRCAEAIEKAVAERPSGNFPVSITEGIISEFGAERTAWVIANTINERGDWDKRISDKNREWAASVGVPASGRNSSFAANIHSCYIDDMAKHYQQIIAEKLTQSTERSTDMAEHNTTFEVSSMTQLENAGNVKALANVVINGEIAVNGIKVVEGEKGLFAAMPSKKVGNEFMEVAHTITPEASKALTDAVLDSYNQLAASGEKTLKNDLSLDKAKPVTSQIDVSLHAVSSSSSVVAAGQVKIDDCFVIKDIKVIKPADKPEFAAMPTYQNQNGK